MNIERKQMSFIRLDRFIKDNSIENRDILAINRVTTEFSGVEYEIIYKIEEVEE